MNVALVNTVRYASKLVENKILKHNPNINKDHLRYLINNPTQQLKSMMLISRDKVDYQEGIRTCSWSSSKSICDDKEYKVMLEAKDLEEVLRSIKDYYNYNEGGLIPKHYLDNLHKSLTVASKREIKEFINSESENKILEIVNKEIINYKKSFSKDEIECQLKLELLNIENKTISKERKKELKKITQSENCHLFNQYYDDKFKDKISFVEELETSFHSFTDILKHRYREVIPNDCDDLIKDIDNLYKKDIPEECHQETYSPPSVKKYGRFAEFFGDCGKNYSNTNDLYCSRRKSKKQARDNQVTRDKESDIGEQGAKRKYTSITSNSRLSQNVNLGASSSNISQNVSPASSSSNISQNVSPASSSSNISQTSLGASSSSNISQTNLGASSSNTNQKEINNLTTTLKLVKVLPPHPSSNLKHG